MSWLARRVAGRAPSVLLVAGLALYGLGKLVAAVLRRPALAGVLVCLGGCGWLVHRYGPATVAAFALGVLLALVVLVSGWSWLSPGSFERRVLGPVRSWRRARFYAARWSEAMDGCGLVRADVEPVLMSCRTSAGVDRLTVHLAPGQLVAEWRDAAPRLRSAFEVRSVRVRQDGPRDLLLLVRWREVRWHDDASDVELEAEVAETMQAETAALLPDLPPATPVPSVSPARPVFPRRPR